MHCRSMSGGGPLGAILGPCADCDVILFKIMGVLECSTCWQWPAYVRAAWYALLLIAGRTLTLPSLQDDSSESVVAHINETNIRRYLVVTGTAPTPGRPQSSASASRHPGSLPQVGFLAGLPPTHND